MLKGRMHMSCDKGHSYLRSVHPESLPIFQPGLLQWKKKNTTTNN